MARMMESSEPVNINSFIVLDLETTGLPCFDKLTKITEISLLCLDRSQIMIAVKNKQLMPRVVQKLNLCVYPCRFINCGATEVSGLNNELLETCKTFGDVFDIILEMINMMPKPICMVAHNGNKFDFPILRSEIAHIKKNLPDDIYCADTLPAFKEFVYKNKPNEAEELDEAEQMADDSEPSAVEKTGDSEQEPKIVFLPDDINPTDNGKYLWGTDDWNDELIRVTELIENELLEEVNNINLDEIRKVNETTPKRRTNCLPSSQTGLKKKKINHSKDKINASKNLFSNKNSNAAKHSYKLKDCYEYLTEKKIINQHRADSDTHALLECIVKIGPQLLDWFDNNCKPFNNVTELWNIQKHK
ncbi:uncharacterized protein LOC142329269 [Lycorma delicatula]|uniref:uncharacterized protein LOC142329269 n=1 Tax=Lycorma delicatula TaxID=130591 RepID=UPI003F5180FF